MNLAQPVQAVVADSTVLTAVAEAITGSEFILGYSFIVVGGFALISGTFFCFQWKSLKQALDSAIEIDRKSVV